jgi:hypothetical protein
MRNKCFQVVERERTQTQSYNIQNFQMHAFDNSHNVKHRFPDFFLRDPLVVKKNFWREN